VNIPDNAHGMMIRLLMVNDAENPQLCAKEGAITLLLMVNDAENPQLCARFGVMTLLLTVNDPEKPQLCPAHARPLIMAQHNIEITPK
jgi:hypothetical protein